MTLFRSSAIDPPTKVMATDEDVNRIKSTQQRVAS